QISTKVVPLDDVLHDDEPIDLIKIDVQGFEHSVLRGALKTLQRTRALLVETNFTSHYCGDGSFGTLFNHLTELGFEFWNVSAPYRGSKGRALWAHGVFLNRPLAASSYLILAATAPTLASAPDISDANADVRPRSLKHLLLYGSTMLGLGIGIERVLSFVSVTLAARIGGPQAFGGYAVTLATAGAIAAYAGAGIGVTAVRFSGDYRPGSAGYRQFVKALGVLAICSALIAALFTFVGAGPIARWLLGNGDLAVVIRVAAISAGAMVLLDCCRGLLLGQQKFYGLLLLSLVSGVGLIVALPLASRIGATAMVTVQGSVALLTVIVFMVASPRLGIRPTSPAENDAPVPIRQVFAFGLVQFSAFAGISIATWCIASCVARADSSLKQMAFYSVANQWRGLAAMAPGLLTQVIYSSLTNKSSEPFGGPDRVLLSTTLITAILVMLCGGLAIVGLPWILPLVYGHRYAGAETAVSLLLATSIIHMSGQPAAQRLSIVRLRAIGIVNLIWSSLLI